MNTKYNIGDVVSVIDYYDNVFASNIISIKINSQGVCYELNKTESSDRHIIVRENPDENGYYRIIKVIGTIN